VEGKGHLANSMAQSWLQFASRAVAAIALLLLLAVVVLVVRAGVPQDAVEAHKYACGVLLPRFVAALNDWHYQHPQDRPGQAWEHCEKFCAKDAARWKLVRESFRELDAAMRRAGY
jgi:hypothetical protein